MPKRLDCTGLNRFMTGSCFIMAVFSCGQLILGSMLLNSCFSALSFYLSMEFI